jgi:hypothetical protein
MYITGNTPPKSTIVWRIEVVSNLSELVGGYPVIWMKSDQSEQFAGYFPVNLLSRKAARAFLVNSLIPPEK